MPHPAVVPLLSSAAGWENGRFQSGEWAYPSALAVDYWGDRLPGTRPFAEQLAFPDFPAERPSAAKGRSLGC